jgi:hypothetical protein
MNGQTDLHLSRLRESLKTINTFRDDRVTALDSSFKTWREGTQESLSALFGEQHAYTRRFSSLQFWEPRLCITMSRSSGPAWSHRDQEIFHNDLDRARAVLTDAIEKFPLLADQAPPATVRASSARPQIVVNVTHVLSQNTPVGLSQILATLDSLGLPPDKLSEAKLHAKELAEEAQGQQRWRVLAKSLEALESMGKSVYENVALPILLEMPTKQTGPSGCDRTGT